MLIIIKMDVEDYHYIAGVKTASTQCIVIITKLKIVTVKLPTNKLPHSMPNVGIMLKMFRRST